jgi:hypothetical protein
MEAGAQLPGTMAARGKNGGANRQDLPGELPPVAQGFGSA